MRIMVEQALRSVRRKVQTERVIKGIALLLLFGLIISLVSTYYLARMNFSEASLVWVRVIAGLGFLLVSLRFVAIPLLRPPSKSRIARFLEERYPSLRERVTTAIELEAHPSKLHSDIKRLVENDARNSLRRIERPRFYWPGISGLALASSVTSVLVFLLIYLGGPEVYRYSLNKLAWNWIDESQPPLYQILVNPGDTVVGERADLEVQAALVGFEANDVRITVRYEKHPQWETVRMVSSADSSAFSFLFFDIRERIEYFVEAAGIATDTYTIEVSDLPRVETLVAILSFPEYTGMVQSTREVEGSIYALEGTSVRLEVTTNQPVRDGVVRFRDSREIALSALDSTRLEASFEIRQDDSFRIYLTNSEGVSSPGSEEYLLEALDDRPPSISFTRPGRDKKVTNIEEVYLELRAEDDYGINDVSLRYSVNGGPDLVAHPEFRRGNAQLICSETLFLEDMDLQPGDFISYFAEASDAVSTNTTDIYFLEVEPFTRELSQSQRTPVGSGQRDLDLSRQQKQIVVATFSLVQEADEYSEDERKENSMTLALLQQRIETQVRTVVERIRRREAAMADPRLQKMSEYLDAAARHMKPAEEFLAEVKPSQALPDEKSALQYLMRSEALFTEVEVALSDSGNGGGGSLEELVDLVDLELDRTKNQYETYQAGRGEEREEALDDALEKLRELSKRQEQQIERRKQNGQLGGESLVEEIERLSRQLARLSRQQSESQLSKLSQELERAARDMRRSLASGQKGDDSLRLAQQAMERLKRAQETLARQRRNQVKERVGELETAARQLVEEQEVILDELRELDRLLRGDEIDQDFLKRHRLLMRKKGDLQEDLQGLEGDLHQLARQLDAGEETAARKLRQAGLQIRDDRLPERMEEGSVYAARGLMNMALHREKEVSRNLQDLADNIAQVSQSLGQGQEGSGQERRQQALDDLGDVVEKLVSLRDRLDSGQSMPGERVGASSGNGRGTGIGEKDRSTEREESRAGRGAAFSQLRREWDERVDEVANLKELLKSDPELGTDLSQILGRMRQIDLERILTDKEEVARLKAHVIDSLLQLELEISHLLQHPGSHYLRPMGESEVPGEFRESVEEYHRRLSASDR